MKFKTVLPLVFASFIVFQISAFAFSNPFQKKQDIEKETKQPMVHTVDEWMESATSVKMDMRQREEKRIYPEKDGTIKEELIPPEVEIPSYIERYNVNAGSKELDLTNLLKEKMVRSPFISDPNFENAIYSEIYYYPQTRQVASTMYLIELDKHLGKKERLNDVSVFEHTRYPLISTALPYLKEGFFSTLTFVDFSSDSKTFIAKEKRGSNKFGLYETYVWLYYITDEPRELNSCYMNNLEFANEMKAFESLQEDSLSSNSPFNIEDEGNFDFDFNKLQTPPNSALNLSTPPNNSLAQNNIKEVNNGENSSNQKGTVGKNEYDTNWMLENVTNLDHKKTGLDYGMKEEDIPKIDYREIRNFIKAVWKEDSKTSPIKSRWYNKVPVDFRVDDPYIAKKSKGFGVRLSLLNEMIKAYWFDRSNLILNYIRWDLNPLGFNSNNKNEIVVTAFAYGKNGEKVSLGNWGVDINNGLPRLIPNEENIQIEANAFYIVKKLNN